MRNLGGIARQNGQGAGADIAKADYADIHVIHLHYDSDMERTDRLFGRRWALLQGALQVGTALAAGLLPARATQQQTVPGDDPAPTRLPNGQLQSDAILKADYQQNLKDARDLTALSKSIELDFDKNGQNILSLGLLKKLDDVERITKRIRGRVKR